jgi:uncharacterized protein YyaL (SSP411 family)
MRTSDGAFAASQDADTIEGEGVFYTWTRAQVEAVVGERGMDVCRALGVAETDSVLTLRQGDTTGIDDAMAMLHDARGARVAPDRDDKVIAAWNGLAIEAFALAGTVLARPDLVQAAVEAGECVWQRLVDADGRVRRSYRGERVLDAGFLEDAAAVGNAFVAVYEATGEVRWFERALAVARRAESDFRDGDGIFTDVPASAERLYITPRTVDDSPSPSGQAQMARLSLRMYGLTMDEAWLLTARAIIEPLRGMVGRNPLALPAAAAAMEWLVAGVREVAIAGDGSDAATRDLVATVSEQPDPFRVVAWGEPGVPLLDEKSPLNGRPTAYVCEGFVCKVPAQDRAGLMAQLSSR